MNGSRSLVVTALAAWATVVACGDGGSSSSSSSGGVSSSSGGSSGSGPGDGGNGTTDAATDDDSGIVDSEITVVDVADTACAAHGGSEAVLYASPSAPAFFSLGKVGNRRFAGTRSEGFALFDADGSNPSGSLVVAIDAPNDAASTGSAVVSVWRSGATIFKAAHDANGQGGPGASFVEEAAFGSAVGGGGDAGLVIWSTGVAVRARGLTANGAAAGDAFELFQIGMQDWSGAVASAGGGAFGAVWSGTVAAGESRLYFTPATNSARTALPRRLLTSTKKITVLGATGRTGGYAALVDIDGEPYLVVLDTEGKIAPPIRHLLGVKRALGVASAGAEVGVLARRNFVDPDDEVPDGGAVVYSAGPFEFRGFLATGEPATDWICLGTEKPLGVPEGAIDSDGNGYAIVYRNSAGALPLVRFDNRGQ